MSGLVKAFIAAFICSLTASTSFASEFEWPKEVLDGWKTHKQHLANGWFYLELLSDNGIMNEKTLYCRNGDQLVEEKGSDGLRVSVFRSGSYFVVAKLDTSSHWDLRQLSPTPEHRIALSPYVYFAYAMFATEFSEDKGHDYIAASPFNPKDKFTVKWRNKDNQKIHGSLVFDPKVAWGCVELRYINQDSIEAKFIGEYSGSNLKSVRIEDPKSPETFSMFMINSDPAPAEKFTLEHYGLSEKLLGDKPLQPRNNSILLFGTIGVVLLIVSILIKKSGILKGS